MDEEKMGCSCLKKKIKFQILLPLSSHNHYHRSGCAVIGIRKSVNRQGGRWQKVKTRGLDKVKSKNIRKRSEQTRLQHPSSDLIFLFTSLGHGYLHFFHTVVTQHAYFKITIKWENDKTFNRM